jgi:hypothetical protein
MQFEAQHGHVILNKSATSVGVLYGLLHLDRWSPRKAINTGGEPFIPTQTQKSPCYVNCTREFCCFQTPLLHYL